MPQVSAARFIIETSQHQTYSEDETDCALLGGHRNWTMREHSHCPPFVVPDGRFREQYRGFIESELFDTMKNTLENFMGEIQNFGFVSNGSRIYYELLLSSQNAFGFVAALNMVLNRTNDRLAMYRDVPQRVAPTMWPLHQYIALEALPALPSTITSNPLPTPNIPTGTRRAERPRLSNQELTVTQSFNTGYEKLSFSDIDSTGRGGEYTVQAGFGRTNGAILWVASIFNDKLAALKCPDVLQSAAATSGPTSTGGSGSNAASSARAPAAFVAAFALFAALAML
ncbi:hypothetical protein BD309DRAFT_981874 [Dichomitus squalens]|nr:hypothetical protein BD309DRAFT_981874 [Dichomitus squalens]